MKQKQIINLFIKGTLDCSNIMRPPLLKEYMMSKNNWTKEEYVKHYQTYLNWVEKQ